MGIQKVKDQGKLSWLESEKSFERPCVNKTAMDSFSQVVAQDAQKIMASCGSLESAAKKYNLKPEVLKDMVVAYDAQKNTVEEPSRLDKMYERRGDKKRSIKHDPEYDKYIAEAEAARENLYHLKQADTSGLENSSSKRILKNKGDYISDVGGPRKQMGSESSNTIFEPNRIEKFTKQKDNGEIVREEKAAELRKREYMKNVSRYETIDLDKLAESIENGELRKANGVNNMSAQEHSGYMKRVPSNGISIFDQNDFERIPEKTAGEKRRDDIDQLAKAKKDRSWVQRGAKSTKSSDFLDHMIDSMMKQDPNLKKIME